MESSSSNLQQRNKKKLKAIQGSYLKLFVAESYALTSKGKNQENDCFLIERMNHQSNETNQSIKVSP